MEANCGRKRSRGSGESEITIRQHESNLSWVQVSALANGTVLLICVLILTLLRKATSEALIRVEGIVERKGREPGSREIYGTRENEKRRKIGRKGVRRLSDYYS